MMPCDDDLYGRLQKTTLRLGENQINQSFPVCSRNNFDLARYAKKKFFLKYPQIKHCTEKYKPAATLSMTEPIPLSYKYYTRSVADFRTVYYFLCFINFHNNRVFHQLISLLKSGVYLLFID